MAPAGQAELSDEELYNATCQELARVEPPQSLIKAISVLLVTAALFVAASVLFSGSGVATILLYILPVLFFHELGHYVGMRLFGYRDVTMFFIPFFGAAVSGQKHGAPVWQQVVMLLLGPLPGIFLALALHLIVAPEGDGWISELIMSLIIINAFNLLPIKPLDGGRIIDLLFFARQPWLAAGFQVLTVLGLGWLVWTLRGAVSTVIFGGLAVVMLLTVQSTYRTAVLARVARATPLKLPDDIDQLTEPQRRELFARVLTLFPTERTPAALATSFRWLYDCLVSHRPGLPAQGLLLGLYLAGIAGSVVTVMLPRPVSPEIAAAVEAENRAIKAISARNFPEAVDEYRKAVAHREKHLVGHPDNATRQNSLMHALSMMALFQSGVEALETYNRALAVGERIAAQNPSQSRWQDQLANRLGAVGQQLAKLGRHEEALEHLNRALPIREKLAAFDPAEWQPNLAEIHEDIGRQLFVLGRPAEAADAYKRALRIAMQSTEKETFKLRRLGRFHDGLASILIAQGRHPDAVEHLQAAVAAYERYVRIDPEWQALFRREIETLTVTLGELLVTLNQPDDAAKAFRKGLENREQMLLTREAGDAKTGKPGTSTIDALRLVSFGALRARDFARALTAADRAIGLAPDDLTLVARRAHALMLLGRSEEARTIYFAHRGKVMSSAEPIVWEKGVADDFATLRKAGLDDPRMAEIETALGVAPR